MLPFWTCKDQDTIGFMKLKEETPFFPLKCSESSEINTLGQTVRFKV